jgi:hypothetical protein
MMNGNGHGPASKEPVERVIDLFVHTPIGLAVMAWKRVPEFVVGAPALVGQVVARRCAQIAEAEGRISEEVRKARMIGQVAVTFGGRQLRKEVDTRLRDARQYIPGFRGDDPGNGATAPPEAPAPSPPASEGAPPPRTSPGRPTAVKGPGPAKAAGTTKAPRPAKVTKVAKATKAAGAPAGPAADLPVREYDGLSASQVVSRLTGLTQAELQAVRAYAEASRGRRTVLLAIDRLMA